MGDPTPMVDERECARAEELEIACHKLLCSPNPTVRREAYEILAPIINHMCLVFNPPRRGEVVPFQKREKSH